MRILHVLAQLPAHTGSGVYYQNLLAGLAAYGHEQAALYATQAGFALPARAGVRQFPVRFQTERLPFPIVGMSDPMPYPATRYRDLQEDERMLEAWREAFRETLGEARDSFQPDLVVLHHLWLLSALALEMFADRRSIGICHNTDLRQAEFCPALKRRFLGQLNELDLVVALSEPQRPLIAASFGIDAAKIVALGGGYDPALFYPARTVAPKRAARIVYAGKIAPAKGVYELLEAFRRLLERWPELRLTLVGTPDAAQGRRLAELSAGNRRIICLPAMPQPQLAALLREQDIFVLPSYYEGLGLAALEALASGLWTVTTEIAGLRALLGDLVNESGAIEYVALPRLRATDQPEATDLARFVADLTAKLSLQIAKVERGERFAAALWPELQTHAWPNLVRRFDRLLRQL